MKNRNKRRRTWLLLKYGEDFIVDIREKKAGRREHGWQSKPNHERRNEEAEQERNHHPRDASMAKRPREQCSPNGFHTGIRLGEGTWKPRPWEGGVECGGSAEKCWEEPQVPRDSGRTERKLSWL